MIKSPLPPSTPGGISTPSTSGTSGTAGSSGPARSRRRARIGRNVGTAHARREAPRRHRSALVFDGRYIQDRYHGIGRYAFHLLAETARLAPSLDMHVLRDPSLTNSRFSWSSLEGQPNLTIHNVAARPFGAREQLVVPGECLRLKGAAYHSPYFALPWLLPASAFVTVHDCIFEHDPRFMPRPYTRLYYRLLMRASLARARFVFVPSRATARDLARFYGVSRRKIAVTPEAADASFHRIENRAALDEVRARYELPRLFVLAVGTRRPHKNFGTLVRAFRAAGLPPGAQLVFVGEADERFGDEAAVAAHGTASVRFLGKVPEADLAPIYNLAALLASPSTLEGFGLPVLEAMACGTPVLCSDIEVFREVAGGAAEKASPSDVGAWSAALARILVDGELRRTLSEAGLNRARSFTWRRAAEAAVSTYRRAGLA